MLDMGFQEPVDTIVSATPKSRQTLLFSATLQGTVLDLSKKHMNAPTDIVVHSEHDKHEHITQKLHYVDNVAHKNRLLNHILREDDVKYAIVFTATKRHAAKLVEQLHDDGHMAAALHGDMNQRQRTRTITNLKKGKFNVLVATDVAARGLDVQSITHVVNFDLPRQIEDYVHRIGRTGRAGAAGTAVSFAAAADAILVKKIEEYTGQKLEASEIVGYEPKAKFGGGPPPQSKRRKRSGGKFGGGPFGKGRKFGGRGSRNTKGRAGSGGGKPPRRGVKSRA